MLPSTWIMHNHDVFAWYTQVCYLIWSREVETMNADLLWQEYEMHFLFLEMQCLCLSNSRPPCWKMTGCGCLGSMRAGVLRLEQGGDFLEEKQVVARTMKKTRARSRVNGVGYAREIHRQALVLKKGRFLRANLQFQCNWLDSTLLSRFPQWHQNSLPHDLFALLKRHLSLNPKVRKIH